MEKVKEREDEFKEVIERKQLEIGEWEQKVKLLDEKIIELNVRIDRVNQENNSMIDERLNFEAQLEKKDNWVHSL
jgi:serine phosphatase RsbU (regulator of sigma subunit)